jgi:hypothetical protein
VQFVKPVIHVAKGTEQAKTGFGESQGGFKRILVLLPLVNAGELLGFGG